MAGRNPPGEERAAAPPPPPPPPSSSLAELLDAANDAARREVSQQWFFFITLMLLLAASVGTTTHRALLEAMPMRVPILNIDLPMIGFYSIAPMIFVVMHFYALLQVHALRGKVTAFVREAEAEARRQAAEGSTTYPEALERVLGPLDGFAVVQAIAAARLRRGALAARAMTAITLVIAPVLLLVFFLLRFLPYQDPPTTYLHRALVGLDLLVLWFLMPPASVAARVLAGAGTLAAVSFCILVATVRGEMIDRPFAPVAAIQRALFFDGTLDPKAPRRATQPFSRVLNLRDERLIREDEAELARQSVARTIVLRDRNLRGAVFIASDLRKADLTGADLRGARLDSVWLQGAYLNDALLEGARLDGASLREAGLVGAQLAGVSLRWAGLQGAVLDGAVMTGASLEGASLEGASLAGTQLAGADLEGAELRAASLGGASLEGASLAGARLAGAFLVGARLQGAVLASADLRGADLRRAELWRAELSRADGAEARLDSVDARGVGLAGSAPDAGGSWGGAVAAWLAAIDDPARRDAAARRFAVLVAPGGDSPEARLAGLATLPPPDPRDVAATLATLACAPERAPFVARGILDQIRGLDRSANRDLGRPARAWIARAMLDEKACPGALGLQPPEHARLLAISEGTD